MRRTLSPRVECLALMLLALVGYAFSSGSFSAGFDFLFTFDASKITGEALLRRWDALPAGYTLRTNSNNFANYIRYNARGEIANNSTGGYFIVCFNGQLRGAKAIVLTQVRAVMAGDLDGNGIPESDSGNINSCN